MMKSETDQCIDGHQHFLSPRYVAQMAAAGINDVDGFPLPKCSVEDALAMMDRQDIATAILSIYTAFLNELDRIKMNQSNPLDLFPRLTGMRQRQKMHT